MADYLTLDVAARTLVALVLGGMVFFAFVYAPMVFRTLPGEAAGTLIRAVFPVYYRVNAALTGAAALCLLAHPEGWTLAVVCALFLGAMLGLMPRINDARDAWLAGDESARRRFGRLHGASVAINMLQMLVVLVVFLRIAH